jgi:FixJ family two-component response regulator
MTQKAELGVIVDDDFTVREAISDLLASRNLRPSPSRLRLKHLRLGNPAVPSCLVLDVSLPDIDGLNSKTPSRQSGIPQSCSSAVTGTSHRRSAR